MTTRTALTLTVLVSAACAMTMFVVAITNNRADAEAPSVQHHTRTAVPVVMRPTFDMEAGQGSLDELIEVPTPELTWYAPQSMHDIGGIG